MSIFKRISATISSSIDQVVGEMENHDAVIKANIGDVRTRVAEAKLRLNRVRQQAAQLRQQHSGVLADAERWQSRAVQSAKAGDEEKALQCVHRGQQCREQAVQLQTSRDVYEESCRRLGQDIAESEARLQQLQNKHNLMQARESSSRARIATSPERNADLQQLEEVFDRWEVRLGAADLEVEDCRIGTASLEREFEDREQQQSLRAELSALMEKEKQV